MADLTLDETKEVVLVDGAGTNESAIDTSGRLYVGREGVYQLDCEKKRLYGLVTEVNLATATEINYLLIRNPAGSGKVLYFQRLTVLLTNTANSSGVIRVYLAPTITSNGTAASIVNTNIGGGGAATVMTAFTSPTISVRGTFAYATRVQGGDGAQPTEINFEGSIAINPGVDLLVTGTPDGTNRNIISSFLWLEK